jgi:hypothetical protein
MNMQPASDKPRVRCRLPVASRGARPAYGPGRTATLGLRKQETASEGRRGEVKEKKEASPGAEGRDRGREPRSCTVDVRSRSPQPDVDGSRGLFSSSRATPCDPS